MGFFATTLDEHVIKALMEKNLCRRKTTKRVLPTQQDFVKTSNEFKARIEYKYLLVGVHCITV